MMMLGYTKEEFQRNGPLTNIGVRQPSKMCQLVTIEHFINVTTSTNEDEKSTTTTNHHHHHELVWTLVLLNMPFHETVIPCP